MKRTLVITVALAVAAIALPVALVAEREEGRPAAEARGLGLDDSQIERIEQLGREHRLGMIDLRAELAKLRITIDGELVKGQPDRAELERLIEAAGEVRVKMQKQRIDHMLKVRKLLDDDQWKRFIEHRRLGKERGPIERIRERRAHRRISGRGGSGRGRIHSL